MYVKCRKIWDFYRYCSYKIMRCGSFLITFAIVLIPIRCWNCNNQPCEGDCCQLWLKNIQRVTIVIPTNCGIQANWHPYNDSDDTVPPRNQQESLGGCIVKIHPIAIRFFIIITIIIIIIIIQKTLHVQVQIFLSFFKLLGKTYLP